MNTYSSIRCAVIDQLQLEHDLPCTKEYQQPLRLDMYIAPRYYFNGISIYIGSLYSTSAEDLNN